MSQDPYQNQPPGKHENPYDGGAYSLQGTGSAYQPHGQSYQQPYQPGYSDPGMYQPAYQRMEGEKAAQLSLILGIVGFFVAGLILGPLAIWQAGKAERLGVPATAGKILGWILTILYGLGVLAILLFVIVAVAGLGATASYSG
ncbi:DUF4190 domain-containing protein [Arthrobacter echini]|uniref:DUF4190 domain-containing protein n=1 Tax=Arthrobacter echini TaxID=1529066 RepID=A0A4S5EA29_9MICC|nr:DUF4190 domain-containing protein [Arthrobacter echini]THJ68571.1 DUF4190 domain-containing protein [Arthrobacter echini]